MTDGDPYFGKGAPSPLAHAAAWPAAAAGAAGPAATLKEENEKERDETKNQGS